MSVERDEIKRINEQLAQLRGSARANDGTVTIETDPTGRITYLYIADYAMDGGPDRLATVIADRHRAAMNDVEAKVVSLYEAESKPDGTHSASARNAQWGVQNSTDFEYTPSHLRRG